ncbi:MAG: hypothetical protein JSV64_08220 [Candidatus Bathyarchaeota archaeon]|nr:MAG: hypothetical protein JSV64_08220 [Candidatus Bathyarchaeota archaeon]
MQESDFESILLEAVDEGLLALGESCKASVYFYVEQHFNVKREEIPQKIEVFSEAIEKIFGVGADYLEILIMKRLHVKIGAPFKAGELDDLTFLEYIYAAKNRLNLHSSVRKMTREMLNATES